MVVRRSSWVIGLLAWSSCMAMANEAVQQAATPSACVEAPPVRDPFYPPAMMRAQRSATVVLDLAVDACGHVTSARVERSAGREFNEAAIASVKGRRLDDARRARVVDGRVSLQIEFAKPQTITPAVLDWPATHLRPRYLPEADALGYAAATEAAAGVRNPGNQMWVSPFRVVGSRFVQVGEPGQRMFWYFLSQEGSARLAVRYRPVIEQGQAVVRVGVLCDDTEDQCARLKEVMLKQGLPAYPPASA